MQTNDDAATVMTVPAVLAVTERFKNRNGCPLPATWFISVAYTQPEYVQVREVTTAAASLPLAVPVNVQVKSHYTPAAWTRPAPIPTLYHCTVCRSSTWGAMRLQRTPSTTLATPTPHRLWAPASG